MPDARQTVTVEMRLERGDAEPVLEAFGDFYGAATRRLHRVLGDLAERIEQEFLPREEERALMNAAKVAFMAENGLTSRQYNSLRRGLEGRYRSVQEASKHEATMLTQRIARLRTEIGRLSVAHDRTCAARHAAAVRKKASKAPTKAQKTAIAADLEKLRFILHQKKRKLCLAVTRCRKAEARAAAAVPTMLFGSRRILRERADIHPNDTQAIARWRRRWEASRNGNFILIGSSDETAGNQTCQARPGGPGLNLLIKTPPGLQAEGMPDRITIEVPMPSRYRDELLRAIARDSDEVKTSIAWRFVRDPDWPASRRLSPWRAFATFDIPVAGKKRTGKVSGSVMGIDINADHLALCLMTGDGNPTGSWRIGLPLRGKSTDRRRAIIGDATTRAVRLAQETGAVMAHEFLDFRKKKQALQSENRIFGSGYARMLSSFAYAQIQSEIDRKCARAGIDRIAVNPAYTSVIGAVNLARRYGLSTHQAAAGAIARRAQGYSERINYIRGLRGRRHTRPAPEDAGRHMWRQWRRVTPDEVRLAAVTPHSPLSAGTERVLTDSGGPSLQGRWEAGKNPGRPGRVATPQEHD